MERAARMSMTSFVIKAGGSCDSVRVRFDNGTKGWIQSRNSFKVGQSQLSAGKLTRSHQLLKFQDIRFKPGRCSIGVTQLSSNCLTAKGPAPGNSRGGQRDTGQECPAVRFRGS
jgi:hypothetical protein